MKPHGHTTSCWRSRGKPGMWSKKTLRKASVTPRAPERRFVIGTQPATMTISSTSRSLRSQTPFPDLMEIRELDAVAARGCVAELADLLIDSVEGGESNCTWRLGFHRRLTARRGCRWVTPGSRSA